MAVYLDSLGDTAPFRDVLTVLETGQHAPYVKEMLEFFGQGALDEPPNATMWSFAMAESWQDEHVAETGEMLRSSAGSVTSAPVSTVDGNVAQASSVLYVPGRWQVRQFALLPVKPTGE